MFGETTISYVKIGNHPFETTIYKWLFGVPGIFQIKLEVVWVNKYVTKTTEDLFQKLSGQNVLEIPSHLNGFGHFGEGIPLLNSPPTKGGKFSIERLNNSSNSRILSSRLFWDEVIQGSLYYQPKQCVIMGKSFKITIRFVLFDSDPYHSRVPAKGNWESSVFFWIIRRSPFQPPKRSKFPNKKVTSRIGKYTLEV